MPPNLLDEVFGVAAAFQDAFLGYDTVVPFVFNFYGEDAGGSDDDQVVFNIQVVVFQPEILQRQNFVSQKCDGLSSPVFSFLSEFQAPAGVLNGPGHLPEGFRSILQIHLIFFQNVQQAAVLFSCLCIVIPALLQQMKGADIVFSFFDLLINTGKGFLLFLCFPCYKVSLFT